MTPVDPQARVLLDRWAATPGVSVARLTATRVRQEDRAVLELQVTPDRLYAVDDIEVPGPAGAMAARVYRPRPGRLQTILYLHGGGFVIGPESYDAPLRQLALSSGCLIVALRHRLAPEHRFPAALEDAVAGATWLAGNVEAVGGLDVPLGGVGDSAGGNIAAVVLGALASCGLSPDRLELATTETVLTLRPDVVVRYWGGDPRLPEALTRRGITVLIGHQLHQQHAFKEVVRLRNPHASTGQTEQRRHFGILPGICGFCLSELGALCQPSGLAAGTHRAALA